MLQIVLDHQNSYLHQPSLKSITIHLFIHPSIHFICPFIICLYSHLSLFLSTCPFTYHVSYIYRLNKSYILYNFDINTVYIVEYYLQLPNYDIMIYIISSLHTKYSIININLYHNMDG